MDMDNMKNAEIDYQNELAKFEKYEKNGVELAFRCAGSCGKLVYQMDVLYGIGCRKCKSLRVRPITVTLTKFGLYYCLFWNWFWGKIYEYKFGKLEIQS